MRILSTLKRLPPLFSGLLCLAAALPALAAEQTYTVAQVVAHALQQNGDLGAFREEKGIRAAGKVRAGLLPNPTLDLEAGTGALTGSSAENSFAIGISQEFLLAGKREKRLAIADREQEIYRWQLADRERIVREAVKTAFYDVVLAEQRLALASRAIELNRQLLEVTRERLTAGDIPELEMNLVKVELARSEGARIDVSRALNKQQTLLSTLMGLPPGTGYAISGKLESALPPMQTAAELKQRALGQRPDVKALQAEKERGDADIILARAEEVPNLTAGFAVRRETTSMEIGGVEGKETAYTVGVKLSLPIPVFDKNQAGVQEAIARRSSSESRLLAASRNVEREVEAARASYHSSEKILSLFQTSILPQLEENLQLTQEAYRLGEVGILAVIQEQKKFFEVSDGYLAALHDRQTALVRLEAAVATEFDGGVQ